MNGASDQLLPRTGLADDQDRAVRPGDLLDGEANGLHRLAVAGEEAEVAARLGLVAQVSGLALEPLQFRDPRFQFGDTRLALPAASAQRIVHVDMLTRSRANEK